MEDKLQQSYQLPCETLPGVSFAHHLADLVEMREFLLHRGIQAKNTRIDRYISYLQRVCSQGLINASNIFKNVIDGRFQQPVDWLLYVLREVHELAWILKGLKTYVPRGIDERLRIIVSGSDFAALDIDSQSRNIQFELRIASYFCQAGCEVDLSQETDVIALTKDQAFYLECKRVGSSSQLSKRLAEAKTQLLTRMPRKIGKRSVYGGIAADVTRVAFTHNGLTFGVTNEHSRDVIQKKLIEIAQVAQNLPLFHDSKSLLFYWLQIHIPSLIYQPPTSVTRFSSYHIRQDRLGRKEFRAAKVFYGIFESASASKDERATPAKKLPLRKIVSIPAGAIFSFDDGLINELLKQAELSARDDNEVIATLSMNGTTHEFLFVDFKMLPKRIIDDWRSSLSTDLVKARTQLILDMYMQRFPYDEPECHEP